jgi:hypothetical protein
MVLCEPGALAEATRFFFVYCKYKLVAASGSATATMPRPTQNKPGFLGKCPEKAALALRVDFVNFLFIF